MVHAGTYARRKQQADTCTHTANHQEPLRGEGLFRAMTGKLCVRAATHPAVLQGSSHNISEASYVTGVHVRSCCCLGVWVRR